MEKKSSLKPIINSNHSNLHNRKELSKSAISKISQNSLQSPKKSSTLKYNTITFRQSSREETKNFVVSLDNVLTSYQYFVSKLPQELIVDLFSIGFSNFQKAANSFLHAFIVNLSNCQSQIPIPNRSSSLYQSGSKLLNQWSEFIDQFTFVAENGIGESNKYIEDTFSSLFSTIKEISQILFECRINSPTATELLSRINSILVDLKNIYQIESVKIPSERWNSFTQSDSEETFTKLIFLSNSLFNNENVQFSLPQADHVHTKTTLLGDIAHLRTLFFALTTFDERFSILKDAIIVFNKELNLAYTKAHLPFKISLE